MELQKLANTNATEKDLKLLISLANCAIYRVVETILRGCQPKIDDLVNAASCYATGVYVTYSSEEAQKMIKNLSDGVQELKDSLNNVEEDLFVSFAEEIGTCSEFATPYTLTERMIMLFVICEKVGLEFDFSWNL